MRKIFHAVTVIALGLLLLSGCISSPLIEKDPQQEKIKEIRNKLEKLMPDLDKVLAVKGDCKETFGPVKRFFEIAEEIEASGIRDAKVISSQKEAGEKVKKIMRLYK